MNATEKQTSYILLMYEEIVGQINLQLIIEKSDKPRNDKRYKYTSLENIETYFEILKSKLINIIELNDAKIVINTLKTMSGIQCEFLTIDNHMRKISKKVTESYEQLIDEDDKF